MSWQSSSSDYAGVSAKPGFPNPGLEATLDNLDLNRFLIKHPAGTFFMQIDGNNWEDVGIFDGDVAVVDRVMRPIPTDLVIWYEAEQFMISKRYKVPLDTVIWGVVTTIIHRYRSTQ